MNSAAPTAIERLARACTGLRVGAEVQARAALHLLDWLGNAAHGARSPQGLAMARWLALQGAGAAPTLAGAHADAAAAAAYHGALGSLLEMDDIHRSSILHPGPVVMPAVLAAAPAATSGAALLGAVVAGCEATVRVGRALGPSHYRWWHSTATAGSFGAAAGVAAVLGLDAAATAQALALAGTRSGGLWQVRHESQWGKAWHMAGAAREGLSAAQLALCGMTGPLGVLDGPSGWFAATAPQADASAIDTPFDGGRPWLCDVSFKPWPACRHAHPAMDALMLACAGRRIAPGEVERIDVHGYDDALRFCSGALPQDEGQARFSIAHALAAWLVWGEPQLAHYSGAALHDATVAALRPRVRLHADPALQARYPAHYGARVVLTLRQGEVLTGEVQDTLGDPARPLSTAAVEAKATMLMRAAGWTPARTEAAVDACRGLPLAPDLGALHAVIAAIPVLAP
jgi:2-methylcitrate dehydratase PrpD